MRPLCSLALCLLAAACDTDSPTSDGGAQRDARDDEGALAHQDAELPFVPIIDQSAWRNYPSELDPLASHQPAVINCNIAGWFIERGALEVSTGDCNYLLVEHPAQRAVPQGGTVQVELVHFDLGAPEPATAHVAVLFGDEVQWELEIPIPSYAYVYTQTFTATRALALGDPIRLHLHNHGQNTWILSSLYAQLPEEP